MKRGSLFFVSFGVGNWNKATLRSLFNKFEDYVQQPTYYNKLVVYSDGNYDYTSVLQEYYNKDCLCYGQKIKHKNGEKLFPPIRRKVFGNPVLSDIDTNANECFNSVLRGKLARLLRRSKLHSKERYSLTRVLPVFQFHWNFMHESEKKVTPAILERQTNKVWTWGNLLHAKLSFT